MRFILLIFLCASAAFAQLDSNSLTVTASRTATLQPDQMVFNVTVQTPSTTNLTDVLTALQSTGITMANFSSVNLNFQTLSAQPFAQQWAFGLAVPIAKMKDTITTLTNVQQTINKAGAMTMSFSVYGAQVSLQATQSQSCSYSDLLNDARTQAQKLADASGLILGNVLALATGSSVATGTSSSVVGYFSALPCSITVKYQLSRY